MKPFSAHQVYPGMLLKYQEDGDRDYYLCIVLRIFHGIHYHDCHICWAGANPFSCSLMGNISFCDPKSWEIIS